jgi:hypothetical protein
MGVRRRLLIRVSRSLADRCTIAIVEQRFPLDLLQVETQFAGSGLATRDGLTDRRTRMDPNRRHVDESLRDSNPRLGKTRLRGPVRQATRTPDAARRCETNILHLKNRLRGGA